MWTYVGPTVEVAVDDGFSVGDDIEWQVMHDGFAEYLPILPVEFEGSVSCAEDEDSSDVLVGTISRILMLTGRRRTVSTEITATPAEHVQVLDLAGFLVAVEPAGE